MNIYLKSFLIILIIKLLLLFIYIIYFIYVYVYIIFKLLKLVIQKSYSIGCIDKNKKELNLNNSQSTLSLNLDGYRANDDYSESPTDNKKSFLRHEHDKINKIMDKLSISSNMDGIHNLMSRLSSRDFVPSNSEPVTTSKFKENGDYLELAKIV